MRPDWVEIILGSDSEDVADAVDAEVIGYVYYPGGKRKGAEPDVFLREEVAHFAPIPDPLARYRGMSWLTPIIRETMGDQAATAHKLKFFENPTPNLVVNLDTEEPERFDKWVEKLRAKNEGALNAFRTMYLARGATTTVVGANMRQIDFKAVQGAGETRIAAAAGTPPVIVGLSEGLDAATYSNYGQARRRFADGTMSPLWGDVAEAFAPIVDVPSGARLWFDPKGISFLQEDMKDRADIQVAQASAIKQLVDAGYEAGSVVDAIMADDMSLLVHSGLFSVQLQPAGTDLKDEGSGNGKVPELEPAGKES
jgi:phage portal protein BeeE